MLTNPSNNTFCSRFLHDLLLFYVQFDNYWGS